MASVAFGPKGNRLVAGCTDGRLRIHNAHNTSGVRVIAAHNDVIHAAAYHPDGTTVVSGADDGTIKIWKVRDGSLTKTLEGVHKGKTWSLRFSQDGSRLYAAGSDSVIRIWNTTTWELDAKLSLLRSQRPDVPYSDHQGIDAVFRIAGPPAAPSLSALAATRLAAGPTTRRELLGSAASSRKGPRPRGRAPSARAQHFRAARDAWSGRRRVA